MIGYMRVSSSDERQSVALQNCAKATCRSFGSSTVWVRSLPHRIRIVEDLKSRGVAFRSLTEAIDTTNSHGAFLFNLFGTLAEYEKALITERVNAGLAAARRRWEGRQAPDDRHRKSRTDSARLVSVAPANPTGRIAWALLARIPDLYSSRKKTMEGEILKDSNRSKKHLLRSLSLPKGRLAMAADRVPGSGVADGLVAALSGMGPG